MGEARGLTLGQYLASIRKDRGLSQRDVEKATSKAVSNAYLSQIENGQIKRPNPNILHALSQLYAVSYDDLFARAGFIAPKQGKRPHRRPHGKALADHNLTPDEERQLIEYLGFLRHKSERDVERERG